MRTVKEFVFLFFVSICFVVVSFLCPLNAQAQIEQVAKDVVKDMSPISGVVVMLQDGDVLIDLGSNKDVKVGDIFTVYVTEKVIRHPVTKKILGKTTIPIAVIEVIKVKPKFSICSILSAKKKIKPGLEVTRFSDIPAIFVDRVKQPPAEVLYGYLKTRLGDLNWLPDVTGGGEKLTSEVLEKNGIMVAIVAEPNAIKMYDRKLRLLRLWPWMPYPRVAVPPAGAPQAAYPYGAPPTAYPYGAPPTGQPPVVSPERAARYPIASADMERALAPRYRKVAEIPQVALCVDIYDLDDDGTLEAIFITEGTLQIKELSETGNTVGHSFRGFGKLVSVSGGEGGYIALNIFIESKQMRSMILRYVEGQLEPVVTDLNFILGFVDLNNDGKRETLLAQDFDTETFFGAKVFKMRILGKKVEPGPNVNVPRDFHLIGATFADLNGDGVNEIGFINEHHKLVIFRGNRKVWMSPRRVGGGVQDISMDVGTDNIKFPLNIPVETMPLPIDVDNDGKKELLIPDNKSTTYHLVEGFPTYEYGRISMVSVESLGYTLRPFSGKLSGPVVGLGSDGKEVFCGLVKGSLLWGKATSYILAFPKPDPRRLQVIKQKPQL